MLFRSGDPGHNGARSEGVYFGFVTFSEKLGLAIAMQIAMAIIEFFGYISTEEGQVVTQPQAAQDAIRFLISGIPVALVIIGIVFACRFKIGREESKALHAAKKETDDH